MKKTLIAFALLAAAAGANAAAQSVKAPAPAAATTAPSASENALVNVSGASTVAGAPLLLSVDGAKPVDPSFKEMFDAGQSYPKWKVTQVKKDTTKSRMFLKSATGNASLEMDVATSLVNDLKVQKGSVIEIETQSSGQGALVKFVKDKTPLGFMVNKNTSVIQQK